MNLLIDRQALAIALRHAAQAAGSVAPLDRVVLDAASNELTLTVTDGRTVIRTRLDADVSAPGRVSTEVAGLRKAVQATVAYSTVRLEAGEALRVWAGPVDVHLPAGAHDAAPENPPAAPLASVPDPRAAIRRACVAVEQTGERHGLDFLLLEPGGAVACDGGRLLQEDLPGLEVAAPLGIPRAAALAIGSIPDRLAGPALRVEGNARLAIATLGRVQVTFVPADASAFPAWRDLLPGTQGAALASVDRVALRAAAAKCTTFGADTEFRASDGVLTLRAGSEGREIREDVPITGDFRGCRMNSRLLAEMLAHGPPTVALFSRGPGGPLTWHTGYGQAALMPLRED